MEIFPVRFHAAPLSDSSSSMSWAPFFMMTPMESLHLFDLLAFRETVIISFFELHAVSVY